MVSLLTGERLSIPDAADRCGVHRNTIHRWNRVGHRGERLKLIRLGGRTYVRIDDLERFVAALSDPRDQERDGESFDRSQQANAWLESQGL